MFTLAIVSQKGGSGKTTLAVHLAVAGVLHGKRVALLDLDPQASAAAWHARRKHDEAPDVVKATPAQLPGLLKLAVEKGADIVILDTAPHSDASAAVAAQHADLVLIPCRPSVLDLDAIGASLAVVRSASARTAVVLTCVPTRGTLADEAAEALKDRVQVAPVRIGQRVAYSHALIDGRSASEFGLGRVAAQEVEKLYRWVTRAAAKP